MRRLVWILICLAFYAVQPVRGDTFPLTDGTQVVGEPVSPYRDEGVVFKETDGSFSARVSWDRFTQEAIVHLRDAAKTAGDRDMVDPLIETSAERTSKRKDIPVKPVQMPPQPDRVAGLAGLLTSPVGLFIFLVLYGANIFAAAEVAGYRGHPRNLVCGLAAIPFFGVLSPIAFLVLKPKERPRWEVTEMTNDAPTHAPPSLAALGGMRRRPGDAPPPETEALPTVPPVPSLMGAKDAPAAALLPAPIVYARGEYSFNRRFFETKLTGFFRIVPSAEDKDLRIFLRSSRGEFVGRRIMRITAAELYLQVGTEDVTAEEMIPFTEVMEVQVKHKDLA